MSESQDPAVQWNRLVAAYLPRCKTRGEAVRMAQRDGPAIHQAYLSAVNRNRPGASVHLRIPATP